MKRTIAGILLLLATTMMISGCGGGKGGEGTTQSTKASIKLFTQGTTTFTIGAIQATLHLPAGVSVKTSTTTTNPSETAADVVVPSGSAKGAEFASGVYSAGTLTVFVTKATVTTGFITVGEFVTVNCDIAAGTKPTAAKFGVTNLQVWDIFDAVPITGLTPSFTADIK